MGKHTKFQWPWLQKLHEKTTALKNSMLSGQLAMDHRPGTLFTAASSYYGSRFCFFNLEPIKSRMCIQNPVILSRIFKYQICPIEKSRNVQACSKNQSLCSGFFWPKKALSGFASLGLRVPVPKKPGFGGAAHWGSSTH